MSEPVRRRLRAALAAYAALLLWLLFFQRLGVEHTLSYGDYLRRMTNLRPLYTIGNFWRAALRDARYVPLAAVNLGGNVLLFVPLGFLLAGLFRSLRRLTDLSLVAALLFVTVETVQLLTRTGCWDVDDILLNLLGTLLGRAFWTFPPMCAWRDGSEARP